MVVDLLPIKNTLPFFTIVNKERLGKVRSLRLSKGHIKSQQKKWQGGHLLGAFRGSAFAPLPGVRQAHPPRQRLRRPSNPGRACICNFFSKLINIKIYFFTPRIFLYIIIIFIIKIHYSLNFYLIIFCSVNNNFGTKNIKYQYLFYFHIVGIYFKVICLILSFPDLSITKIMSSQTS